MSDCIFCNYNDHNNIVNENRLFIAIYDKFPVNRGHTLIIPKFHVENIFEIDSYDMMAFHSMLKSTKKILDLQFKPDGYNIGINSGHHAGQTVFHLHVHMIPRYKDDVDPDKLKGGIRNFKVPLVEY